MLVCTEICIFLETQSGVKKPADGRVVFVKAVQLYNTNSTHNNPEIWFQTKKKKESHGEIFGY